MKQKSGKIFWLRLSGPENRCRYRRRSLARVLPRNLFSEFWNSVFCLGTVKTKGHFINPNSSNIPKTIAATKNFYCVLSEIFTFFKRAEKTNRYYITVAKISFSWEAVKLKFPIHICQRAATWTVINVVFTGCLNKIFNVLN